MEFTPESFKKSNPILPDVRQRFSQSLIWQLQRNAFNQQENQAGKTLPVPHYSTNNPFIANAYGKVIFGFLRDCIQNQNPSLDLSQPLYIVELESGIGRFAYYFLKQFFEHYSQSALKHIPITYVMTDVTQEPLNFWQSHPSLQTFIDQGMLDFAQFDLAQSQTLTLIKSGQNLSANTLKNPMIVIANDLFNHIPHDIFHVQDGKLFETLVTFTDSHVNTNITDSSQLDRVKLTYTDVATVADDYYDDPAMNQMLQDYQALLLDTSLLFPIVGLQGLNLLRQLSGDRLLILSAAKGVTRLIDLEGRDNPASIMHEPMSLMVNYHAIARYSQIQGGQALIPDQLNGSVAICGFLFGASSKAPVETQQAYQTAMLDTSPDDFFALNQAIEFQGNVLTLKQLLAYLRLSRWDFKIFLDCFDSLINQVETASEILCDEVYQAVQNIWQTYYFIGEEQDLPFHCAMLLFRMGYYDEAINYLSYSLQYYGDDPEILYSQAMCYMQLESFEKSLNCLEQALALSPDFEAAQALKDEIDAIEK